MTLTPLESRDIASLVQNCMSTRDIMISCSCSRGVRKAFIPQLDKRLIILFGLAVAENAEHQQVMKALLEILPGETQRVITQFNELFSSKTALSDIATIGQYLFRGYEYVAWREVRFCIETAVIPFETRTSLVELGCKLWMQHSCAISNGILRVHKNAPLLRCLLSIGRTLQARHPDALEPKLLTSLALGYLAAQEGKEMNNAPYRAAFKARWSSLTACEQAQALLSLTFAFLSLTDLNDPVVAFVEDLLNDKSLTWAFPMMHEACQYILEQLKFAKAVPQVVFVFARVRMVAIHALLNEMANLSSNNERVQGAICGMLRDVMDGSIHNYPRTPTLDQVRSTWEGVLRRIPEQVGLVRMANEVPDVRDIPNLLANHANEKECISAFTRYKQGWSKMAASEQARAMILLFFDEKEYGEQAVQVLYEFVVDYSLSWANSSMQDACLYCIKNNRKLVADGSRDPYYLIRDMLGVIASPSYKDDLPTVYSYLSKMIDLLMENQDVTELIDEWFTFAETLVIRKIEELSLLMPPKPKPAQPSGYCVLL